MPAHKTVLHLLAYDIADPLRLTQVHRTVRARGLPLQYSVFLVPATAAEIDALLGDLKCIIDARRDDIRVYPLPARLEVVHYGRQWLPAGVQLTSEGTLEQTMGRGTAALLADDGVPARPNDPPRARRASPNL